jgi:hypothetical protein
MKPTVGRIVHYGWRERWVPSTGPAVEKFGELKAVAAIITEVYDESPVVQPVKLHVFLPNGEAFFAEGRGDDGNPVAYSETLEAGKWTWPPRA